MLKKQMSEEDNFSVLAINRFMRYACSLEKTGLLRPVILQVAE